MRKLLIGLEIHIQLATTKKLFCSCSSGFGYPPNTTVCPICMGYPGTLPVLNHEAVEMGIALGIALKGSVQEQSHFDRKNYFYPDLPKGYQITQFSSPLVKNAFLRIQHKKIRIERIHLEEDSAKIAHLDQSAEVLIDYNRSGIPLLEVVTKPDITSPDEAVRFLTNLKQIAEYIGISSGRMEEGALRCDVNISLSASGKKPNYRIEVKNLNSFKSAHKSILFELHRQEAYLNEHHRLVSETRGYDEKTEETYLLRKKVNAYDYRYFPEPDLLPIQVKLSTINRIGQQLPELPGKARRRLVEQYPISIKHAIILTDTKELSDFFEKTVSLYPHPKKVIDWLFTDFFKNLKKYDLTMKTQQLSPSMLASLLRILEEGRISRNQGKVILENLMKSGGDPETIIRTNQISQENNPELIDRWIQAVLLNHPNEIAVYQSGKNNIIDMFVGEVLDISLGKANPVLVKTRLEERLMKKGSEKGR